MSSYSRPRTVFVGNSPDLWTMLIPQISFHANGLRLVMIACGTVALSLMRRENGEAEKESMAIMERYALRAIRNLSSLKRPLIETVVIMWTFWQLDMLCGKMKSSMMHVLSAQKFALENPSRLSSDALASSLVTSMTEGMPVVSELEIMMAGSNFEVAEFSIRKQLVVNKLWTTYSQICECYQRIQRSECTANARILGMLGIIQQEIEWILSRWEEPKVYLQRLENKRLDSISGFEPSARNSSPAATDPRPFQKIVDALGPYSAGPCGFSIDDCLQHTSTALLLLLVAGAGSNLEMRQDSIEFLEFSNKIRQIRAFPAIDHVNVWASYADLVLPRQPYSLPISDHVLPAMKIAKANQIQTKQDIVSIPFHHRNINEYYSKAHGTESFASFKILNCSTKTLHPECASDG